VTNPWFNQTLCKVNDSVVRVGIVMPEGVRHRPRSPDRTVIPMVEGAGIVPTGDPS